MAKWLGTKAPAKTKSKAPLSNQPKRALKKPVLDNASSKGRKPSVIDITEPDVGKAPPYQGIPPKKLSFDERKTNITVDDFSSEDDDTANTKPPPPATAVKTDGCFGGNIDSSESEDEELGLNDDGRMVDDAGSEPSNKDDSKCDDDDFLLDPSTGPKGNGIVADSTAGSMAETPLDLKAFDEADLDFTMDNNAGDVDNMDLEDNGNTSKDGNESTQQTNNGTKTTLSTSNATDNDPSLMSPPSSILNSSSYSTPITNNSITNFFKPSLSERTKTTVTQADAPLRDVDGATYISLHFRPDGDKHPVRCCIDGFKETLNFIQKVDPSATLLPVHKDSPHPPLVSSTDRHFPAVMAELGSYLHIQNAQDTCRPNGMDDKGKQRTYKGTWGSALMHSRLSADHIIRNVKGDLDARNVVINKKYIQELDTRSDLAIISVHNDVDQNGMKFVMVPLLWATEERLWCKGKNLHWKNTQQPDFKIVLRGAKEPRIQDAKARSQFGFADAARLLKRIFHVEIPSPDYIRMRSVWEAAFDSGEAQHVLGRRAHLLKTGLSGPRCEQSKKLFSRFVRCHIAYNIFYVAIRIPGLVNPGAPVRVTMELPLTDKDRPWRETSIRKEMEFLQTADDRFGIFQVVPYFRDDEVVGSSVVIKNDSASQELVNRFASQSAAWFYHYLTQVRQYKYNKSTTLRLLESWNIDDRAVVDDSTWDPETWEVTTPHEDPVDEYFKQQEMDGCLVDGMDLSQLVSDKSSIDLDHAAAVEQVKAMYRLKGTEEIDSRSGASARTGATHSTGGDNNSIRSVTTVDLKTNYKTTKVDLALTKAEVARQQEEIAANKAKADQYFKEMEALKAQLALLGKQQAPSYAPSITNPSPSTIPSLPNEIPPTPQTNADGGTTRVSFAMTENEMANTV